MKKFYTFEPKNFRIFSKMKSFVAVALLLLMAIGNVNAQTAQLVTDASTLAIGDQIIIVSSNAAVALGVTQNTNNRDTANVTKEGNTITFDETTVQVITLKAGSTTGTFAMNVGENNYLYAASSSSNWLRTQTTIDANASWSFTQNGNSVDIVAQGSYTHNTLRYNSSSHLFSCYVSGQVAVSIYKVDVAPCTETRTDNISICEYSYDHSRDYYNFYGTNLLPADAGTHVDTVPGVGGACDTIVTLNLSVIPGEYEYDVTINEGESFEFAGDIISTAGDHSHYYNGNETSCGCDSFVVLHVTVNPVVASDTMYEEVAAICEGQSYTFSTFDGIDSICTETNIYMFTKEGAAQGGHDSVRVLYLDVNPTYNVTITDSICQGTEYQFGAGALGYHFDANAEPGVYNDLEYTFETVNGCDSNVTLTLVISPVYNEVVEATFCENQLPQNVGDIVVEAGTTTGEYTYNLQSIAGCDSTVTLQLTVNPIYAEDITETVCASALPHMFRGHEWTAAGSETYAETTVNGCDSIVNYTLVVAPVYNEEVDTTICPAELATFEFRGHSYTEGGTFNYNETSINGCDSNVVFTLNVIPVYNRETKDTTICVNETPYVFYGQNCDATGTYVVSLTACGDTTATLNLTVNETNACTFTVDIEAGENGTIEGSAVVNHGANYDYVITPENCYYIESVTLDGTAQTITDPDGMTLTLDSVHANHVIAATFAQYQYEVTATGTVEASATYACGETAHYTFAAETGYHIDSLYIDGALNTASYNETWFNGSWDFNMTGDHSIAVYYSKNHFTVSASASGIGGTINPVGDTTYEFDAFPTYTFTYEECIGIHSILVNGTAVEIADSYTFDTLWSNSTIEVLFDTAVYDLTSVFHGPGLGTVNGQPEGVFGTATCASTVRDVYVDADATTHSRIDSVKWNGLVYNASDAPQYQQHMDLLPVTMDGTNHVIDVYFNREYNHVYASVTDGQGQALPADSIVYYTDPSVVTAIADHGWHVATITCGTETWTNINGNADSIVEFALGSVISDTNVYVTFEINEYTITINTNGEGTTTPAGPTVTVQYGDNFTLTAAGTSCTFVDSIVVDNAPVASVNLTNIENDHVVDVYFEVFEYTMTGSGDNGAVVTGDPTASCGSNYTYTITAADNYHVDSVYVNGVFAESYTGEQGEVTHVVMNVTEDKDLTAYTSLNHYNVTATATNGTINPASASVEHGGSVSFQMVPTSDCYELTEVLVNNVSAMADVVEVTENITEVVTYDFANVTDMSTSATQQCEAATNEISYTTVLPGWQGSKVYGANGKLKLGTTSVKGSLTTPALDLSTNGGAYTITFDAKAWDDSREGTTIKVTVGTTEYTVTDLPKTDCDMQTFTISGTDGQAGTTIKFESANASRNRFFLDNIHVVTGNPAGYALTVNNITEATTVAATFDLIDYTMSGIVANDEGGTVTASADTAVCGSEQSYTLTAEEGWHIANYVLNGTTTTVDGVVASLVVPTTIAGDDTLTVDFDINTYTVTAHIAHQAGSYDQGVQTVNHGQSATINFTADAGNGYHIEKITCGEDIVTLDSNAAITYAYTVNEVVSDTDVYVYFKHNEFPITVIFDETAGEVNPLTQNWEYGATVVFHIAPNDCKYIDSILIDNIPATVSNAAGMSYTFNNVIAEHTIEVVFADSMFTMTGIAMGSHGTINSGEAVCGGNFIYHIVANEGYHVNWVMIDGENVPEYTDLYVDSLDIEFNDIHEIHVVRVNFEIDYYDINITYNEGGVVSPEGVFTNVIYDSVFNFVFTPEACQELVSFTINDVEYVDSVENNAYTWHANASGDIIATFDTIVYEMAETHTGEGTVTDGAVNCGEDYTYTITAEQGWHIASYTIGGNTTTLGTNDDVTATVDVLAASSDTTLDVIFASNAYTVQICDGNAIVGGTVTVDPATVLYDSSFTYTVTADAANGYHIVSVTVNGTTTAFGNNDDVTFTDVVANVVDTPSVCAEFALNNYTITAIAYDNGNIDPDTVAHVNWGDSMVYVITSDVPCYYVDRVVIDSNATSFVNDSMPYSYTFRNIHADHLIEAYFAEYTYDFTSQVLPDPTFGTVSSDSAVGCTTGTYTYNIEAARGYHIVSVNVDGTDDATFDPTVDSLQHTVTIADFHEDHHVIATFAINHYLVDVTAGDHGTITPGDTVLEDGESVTYTITPDHCYYISELLVNGETATIDNITGMTYTFNSITAAQTLEANFAIYQYLMGEAHTGDGTVTTATVNCDDPYTYTITAGTGSHIESYTIGGNTTVLGTNNDVTANVTVAAATCDTILGVVFAKNVYPVVLCDIDPAIGSMVTVPDSVEYGQDITVTVNANTTNGYHIETITGGNAPVTLGDNSDVTYAYIVTNVVDTPNICATFDLNNYYITTIAHDHGNITSGPIHIQWGQDTTVEITSEVPCYYIDYYVVDGIATSYVYDTVPVVYNFTNVTSDRTIEAFFAEYTYDFTSEVRPDATFGTVTSATAVPCTDGSYTYDIQATRGYHIVSVNLDGANDATYDPSVDSLHHTVTITDFHENHHLIATFALNHYEIVATAGDNGTVTPAGTTVVADGDTLTYTIRPADCYYINSITVDGADIAVDDITEATYTFENIQEAHTIAADFAIYRYVMDTVINGEGTVTSDTVDCGSFYQYTMTAADGWHIQDHTLGGVTYTLNHNSDVIAYRNVTVASQDTVLTVNFARNTYTIDVTSTGNGATTPGDTTVEFEASVTYTMIADTGYHIGSVLVDGTVPANFTAGSTTYPYLFDTISANHTLVVNYETNTYNITAGQVTNGTIMMPGTTTVNYGESVSYTITANSCYHISEILVDNVVDTTFDTNINYYVYTFNNVDSDHTIDVNFAVNTYDVQVVVNGSGIVTPTAGTYTYNCDTTVDFTFTPADGSQITSVIVNGHNIGTPTSYTISNIAADYTVEVNFDTVYYTLNATAYNYGTITPMGDTTVAFGSTVTYTLTPNDCQTVSELLVNGISYLDSANFANNTLTISDIQRDMTIQAYFQVMTYTVEAEANDGGVITETGVYNCGTAVAYQITADECHTITEIVIDGTSTSCEVSDTTITFDSISADHTIEATFTMKTYTITASVNDPAAGSITATDTFDCGAAPIYEITPNEGYHIINVLVDSVDMGVINTYTFASLHEDHEIIANFGIDTFMVSAYANAGVTITPFDGDTLVEFGSSLTFNFTADSCYVISDVTVDGESMGAVDSITLDTITANHVINVTAVVRMDTIVATATEGGYISPAGTTLVACGGSQLYIITPANGYEIEDVMVDGESIGDTNTYLFENVNGNHTIDVTFHAIADTTFIITSTAGANGTISPLGDTAVSYGASVTYYITPDQYYTIAEVMVDSVVLPTPVTTYTFSNVMAPHTISVTFTAATCPVPTYAWADDITMDGATLNWTDMDVTSYTVRYKKASDTVYTEVANITDNFYTLTGLEEATRYVWNVKSVCITDTAESNWTSQQTFVTLGDTTSINPGIQDLTISDVRVYSNGNDIYVVNNGNAQIQEVQVYDMNGRVIFRGNAQSNPTVINLNAANGIYVVRVMTEAKVANYKVSISQR
ncbi:MAG: T9SS type A sorting domain-containing protein [Bacteroidales bacterium]|nr:T9SS type A sorting domain-containing protein [Bacteroidales bacterium]